MQEKSFGFIKNSRHGRRLLMLRWVLFVLIAGIVLLFALFTWQDQTDQTDLTGQTRHAQSCRQPRPGSCLHNLVSATQLYQKKGDVNEYQYDSGSNRFL